MNAPHSRHAVVHEEEEQAAAAPRGGRLCANCGARLHGRYCHRCGERALEDPEDHTLAAALRRGRRRLACLGERAFRSFLALFFKPGFLADEYLRGRRIRYLGPLHLFIVANVCFYFFASWTGLNPFQAPFHWHADAVHTPVAKPLVEREVIEEGLTYMGYVARFDHRAEVLSKTLVISMVPLFALLLLLAHGRRERLYARHAVFALHFFAFLLLVPLLLWALMGGLSMLFGDVLGTGAAQVVFGNAGALAVAAAILAAYLFAALRRRYRQPAWLALLKSAALVVGLYYVIIAYRVLLFFVTFYSL